MKRKVYLVCPVRNANASQIMAMDRYVQKLEVEGCEVHYPPRDVDQSNDDGGVRICQQHRDAMLDCNEVHVFWDNNSKGSHFDVGMAYMLAMFQDVIFVMATPTARVEAKDFTNVVLALHNLSKDAVNQGGTSNLPTDMDRDSADRFLSFLSVVAKEDAAGLKKAYASYGPSWKSRGGVGAFMMLARKWDRMEMRLKKIGYDIFKGIATDERGEGLIDDVRDLRRYLMLVEAEMRARGFEATHRDNKHDVKLYCEFECPTPGYAPCTREKGHPGPCAHPTN